jgi:hypothetical protein
MKVQEDAYSSGENRIEEKETGCRVDKIGTLVQLLGCSVILLRR